MEEIKADTAISVRLDPSLVVTSASLRRETPTAPGKVYRFIYDHNLTCHLHVGAAGELTVSLGPPGGQEFDTVRLVLEPGSEGVRARAGAGWSRDYGPPHTGPWSELSGELRLNTPWRQGERFDGAFRLAGKIEGIPAVLVGAFHSTDPMSGTCVAETGGPFSAEEIVVPADKAP